jgi:iron complex outermembrane receptor protein
MKDRWHTRRLAIGLATMPAAAYAQERASDIIVNGILPARDSTYRVGGVEVGPLGAKPLLDTPYSISVVPVNLAENQQLQNVRELFRYIPSVQGENIRPQARGLQAGVVQNVRIDGFNIAATTDYAIEQFERIEVLNGLAGALYGPAPPAGTFNFVFKRPTAAPLAAITLGYSSQGSLIAHGDVSERFGRDGWLGARLNLLNQSGENFVDRSDLRRRLASLALDAKPTPTTTVEVNLSTYHYTTKGLPGTIALAKGVEFPETPNPKRVGYGYDWAGDDNVTHIASGKLRQQIGGDWHLTGGALYMTNARASTVPTLTIQNAAGRYTATTVTTTFSFDRVFSNFAALNGRVTLLGLTNDLFLGTTGFTWKRYTPFRTGAITLGTGMLDDPTVFPRPSNIPDFTDRYHSQTTVQQALNVGDTIAFTDRLSLLAAVSQSWIEARNISRTDAVTSRYSDDGLSPTASLIFKPQPNMTAYFTYADSLQQGDNAPAGVANAGEALAPYRSREYEAGYKIDLKRVQLALAAYQIRRPYAFTGADNVYAVRGHQRNRGVELTANGRVTPDLNLFGSGSFIDPQLFDTGTAATDGKRVLGVGRLTFDTLVEYRLPFWPKLTLAANVDHVSRRAGNETNTDFVGGYTIADLTARYQTTAAGRAVAIRLAVLNVSDERYWSNIAPSGQNGYNSTDSGTALIGAPRTIRASVEVGL